MIRAMGDVALIAAGFLGVLAAAVHGIAGEILVVRKLSLDRLAPSPFGGARMTKAMIHVTWHITTFAFLSAGVALLLAGAVLDGDAAKALAILGATIFTAAAALAAGLGGAHTGSPRNLMRHPGPAILTATAVLAWLGAV
jgi:hypothetical protein